MKSVNPRVQEIKENVTKYLFYTELFAICIYNKGMKEYDNWCGSAENRYTLTTDLSDGGYRMCDEIKKALKNGTIKSDDIDVQYENGVYTYEHGQKIINRVMPQKPLQYTINFIVNNSINNSTIINSTVNQSLNTVTPNLHPISDQMSDVCKNEHISSALEMEVDDWSVTCVHDAYRLVPRPIKDGGVTVCCVDTDKYHAGDFQHSWIMVRKLSVTCHCLIHGKKTIMGPVSRSVREVFFDFKCKFGPSREAVEIVLSMAESNGLVRSTTVASAWGRTGNLSRGLSPITKHRENARNWCFLT